MAVSVVLKSGYKTEEILKAYQVPAELAAGVADAGLVLEVGATGISIMKDGMKVGSVPVKSGAVAFAVQGKLAPASLQAVAVNLIKGLQQALAQVGDSPSAKVAKAHVEKKVEPEAAPAPNAKTPYKFKGVAGEITTLEKADKLYQPVSATSAGSRYVVMGLGPSLKVAARLKGGVLSVRVEGDVVENKEALESAGLNLKNGYASEHFHVGTDMMAKRTLGSIMLGLGVEFDTGFPDISAAKEGL
jgi:hypothetical protein